MKIVAGRWKGRPATDEACFTVRVLLGAEGLDLVELGLRQLAGNLALGHLGRLDLVPDLLHDFGVALSFDLYPG